MRRRARASEPPAAWTGRPGAVERPSFPPPVLARHVADAACGRASSVIPGHLISMQRHLGNQAVLRVMQQHRTRPSIQRAGALDQHTTSAERKTMRILTLEQTTARTADELKAAFAGKEKTVPPVESVEFGTEIEEQIKGGLKTVAGDLMNEKSFAMNTVMNVGLPLKAFGGVDGVYRFALVEHKTKPKTQLIVERVGSSLPTDLTKADVTKQEARFKKFDFTWGTDFGSDDAKKMLYAALARVPDSMLERVRGVKFSQKLQSTGDAGEAGHYDPNTHTIEVYGSALAKAANSPDAGLTTFFTWTVVHEMSHAVDYSSYTAARQKRDSAAAKLKQAKLDARKVDPNAGLERPNGGGDRNEQTIRQLEAELNTAEQEFGRAASALDESRGGAGSQARGFRNAAGKPISKYGATAPVENFADSYSLYVLDPDLLKSLRPELFAYFAANFP
jgi:hypothetical protein